MRLSNENNRMLHSMRRSSFIWGFLKFVVYAILFAAPIWFYMTYISNDVDNLVNALNKVDGTAQVAQQKFSGFEDVVKSFEASLPAWMTGNASSSSTTAQ